MPLDIPRSWLIRGSQTSAMITSSTWSFSWQTTTQQCKTTCYFSLDRKAMVRLPEPSRACSGFLNNTWEFPQGLWLWVRQVLAWISVLLSAPQACALSKVCISPWPPSPVHNRPPLIIRELWLLPANVKKEKGASHKRSELIDWSCPLFLCISTEERREILRRNTFYHVSWNGNGCPQRKPSQIKGARI